MYFVPIENLKELEATIESLLQSSNVMLLVRGIPGMGKSYVGKFVGEKFNAIQLETDQQFMTSGEYVYDPSKIEDAHTITQNEAKNLMIDAAPLVIVSNTFTQRWEMKSYEDLAAKYGYTLVVYDLFLQVLLSFPTLSHKNKPVSFLPAGKQNQQQKNNKEYEEYLAHLARSNVHSVPAESMRSMSDRYEFLPQVVTITRNDLAKKPSSLSTSASNTCSSVGSASVAVLDTGRYLSLDVLAPEDGPVLESSALYRQCMEGCHVVLETVGIVTGSAMIKKVVSRNAASHGAAVAFNTKNTHTRNVSKLAAGLGRFHITVLTAAEYKLLKESGVLETFIAQLRGIDLSAISVKKQQQSTKQSSLKCSGNGSNGSGLALGVVTGQILDKQSVQSIKVDEVAKAAGLSADKHSTAFYLLCSDDTEGTTAAASWSTPIRDMETLRLNFGLSNADFVPHVTLGFTHNDIHTKDNCKDNIKDNTANKKTAEKVEQAGSVDGSVSPVKVLLKRGSAGDATESPAKSPNKSSSPAACKGGVPSGVVNMRREGVSAFDAMYRTVHPGKSNSKINSAGAAVTSLTSDHLDLHLVLLVLHSETKVTFTRCFEFTVCDVKIRRTPCGDDAIYKTHRLLQSYLPRGCVFIQTLAPVSLLPPAVGAVEHNAHGGKSEGDCVGDTVVFRPTGTSTSSPSACLPVQSLRIFKGLFSLRKFFGKEGVEDDGVGYAEDQLNFKLNKILAATDTLILMEKVNGRAGSARFFQYNDTTFVIIGTKLSHLVCRVDFAAHTLVPPSWLTDASGNNNSNSSNGDGDDEDNEDSGKLQLQQTNSGNKGHKAPKLSESQTSASSSAASSGIALLREQQFERNALLQSNITGLSNVLHWSRLRDLVAFLGSHTLNGEVLDPEEMHLVTLSKHEWVSLCVSDFPPSITSSAPSSEPQLDTLQLLQQLSQFVTALPEYTVYPLTHHPETGCALSVAEKRERLVRIADSLTFERDSEGKVMYFVQQQHTATSGSASPSRILDMMKYKTWWYVWRRSIREITSKLFTRYANHVNNISSGGSADKLDGDGTPSSNNSRGNKKQQQRAKKNDKKDGSSGSAPMSQLDKLTKQLNSMLLANRKEDAQHQKRLSDLIDQISKLQREEDLRNAPKETANGGEVTISMTPFVEQLCKEIQNKWPSKFSFMKRELGEAYDKNIQGVMAVASAFLCWAQQQCSSGPGVAEFHAEFKKYYPVVWTRFLAETGHSDIF